MRWKSYFFLKDPMKNKTDKDQTENYGFKSRHIPPKCTELEKFEKYLLDVTKTIEFTNKTDCFQKKLRTDMHDSKIPLMF